MHLFAETRMNGPLSRKWMRSNGSATWTAIPVTLWISL